MTTDRASRDAEIASAIASGATAPAVAAEYNLTAQRVRQIAAAAGVEPRKAGRPVTTGRGEARVQVRLSAAERDALAAVAGGADAISAYLRGAGLALPLIVDALDSAGDTLTGEEACGIALGVLRRVVPRRDEATERPRARKE